MKIIHKIHAYLNSLKFYANITNNTLEGIKLKQRDLHCKGVLKFDFLLTMFVRSCDAEREGIIV